MRVGLSVNPTSIYLPLHFPSAPLTVEALHVVQVVESEHVSQLAGQAVGIKRTVKRLSLDK